MYATLYLNGVPVSASAEVQEPAQPGTVQAAIKALSSFSNHANGKATKSDVLGALSSIYLNGKTDK